MGSVPRSSAGAPRQARHRRTQYPPIETQPSVQPGDPIEKIAGREDRLRSFAKARGLALGTPRFPEHGLASVRTSVVKKSMHTKTSRCERAKSSLKTDCFRFGAGETPERSLTWNEDPPATDFCGCINVTTSTQRFVDGFRGGCAQNSCTL